MRGRVREEKKASALRSERSTTEAFCTSFSTSTCVCVCERERESVCECVSVCARECVEGRPRSALKGAPPRPSAPPSAFPPASRRGMIIVFIIASSTLFTNILGVNRIIMTLYWVLVFHDGFLIFRKPWRLIRGFLHLPQRLNLCSGLWFRVEGFGFRIHSLAAPPPARRNNTSFSMSLIMNFDEP